MSLWQTVKESMMQFPHQTIHEKGCTMTYGEMIGAVEELAKELPREACCAIGCQSEMAAATALLSCMAAGVTALPLAPRYGEIHTSRILQAIGPTCRISDEAGNLHVFFLRDSHYTAPSPRPALILSTSGTTGTPKGILLSEDNVQTNLQDIADYFDVVSSDSFLIYRPLYHAAVLTGEFLLSLIKGARIVFSSESFNPVRLAQTVLEQKITTLAGTPTLLCMLSRLLHEKNGHGVRLLSVSGECLQKPAAQTIRHGFPHAEIYHVYGLTEASPRVAYLPPSLFDDHPDAVGLPLRSVRLRLLNRDGKEASPGEEGMLWVKGKNVMQGYYNNAPLTEKVLRNGWLCTGDIALRDADGLLRIRGRSDEMIIRAGMNIYPQEIEAELKKDPRTREALVYGIQDPMGTARIALRIVGEFQNTKEVRDLCVKCLPPFQVPSVYELTDRLPKNGFGKILRGKAAEK